MAAVLTFMTSGALTTTLLATLKKATTTGVNSSWMAATLWKTTSALTSPNHTVATMITTMAVSLTILIPVLAKLKGQASATRNDVAKFGPAGVAGALFALGLQRSGMAESAKISGFLNVGGFFTGTWDATLLFVMSAGLLVSWISYQWVQGSQTITACPTLDCPIVLQEGSFAVPSVTSIDKNLLLGAAIFGIGWGIAGICPGPAVVQAAMGVPGVVRYWWPAYFVGAYVSEQFKQRQ